MKKPPNTLGFMAVIYDNMFGSHLTTTLQLFSTQSATPGLFMPQLVKLLERHVILPLQISFLNLAKFTSMRFRI